MVTRNDIIEAARKYGVVNGFPYKLEEIGDNAMIVTGEFGYTVGVTAYVSKSDVRRFVENKKGSE